MLEMTGTRETDTCDTFKHVAMIYASLHFIQAQFSLHPGFERGCGFILQNTETHTNRKMDGEVEKKKRGGGRERERERGPTNGHPAS